MNDYIDDFTDEDDEPGPLSWQSWLLIAAMAFTAAIAVSFGLPM